MVDTDRALDVEPLASSTQVMREPPRAIVRATTSGVVVYAVAAGAASAVPVPFLDLMVSRLARGAAMRRVAMRRGVRLSPEARQVLSRPGLASPLGTAPARILRTAVTRVLAPIRIASRIEDGAATFLAAFLLDHYLHTADRRPGAQLHEREAEIVRSAMEQAWADCGLEALRSLPVGAIEIVIAAGRAAVALDNEGRGPIERFTDALLDGLADSPGEMMQRIRDHFDAALVVYQAELAR